MSTYISNSSKSTLITFSAFCQSLLYELSNTRALSETNTRPPERNRGTYPEVGCTKWCSVVKLLAGHGRLQPIWLVMTGILVAGEPWKQFPNPCPRPLSPAVPLLRAHGAESPRGCRQIGLPPSRLTDSNHRRLLQVDAAISTWAFAKRPTANLRPTSGLLTRLWPSQWDSSLACLSTESCWFALL
jgi:hypothetical protein